MLFTVDPLVIMVVLGLAFGVEKYYTQRWTIIANMTIIWSTLGLSVFFMEQWFVIWAVGFIVASLIAVLSYLYKDSMPGFFYDISHALYSSKTVLGVLIAGIFGIGSLIPTAFIVGIIWAIAVYFFRHNIPFYGGIEK